MDRPVFRVATLQSESIGLHHTLRNQMLIYSSSIWCVVPRWSNSYIQFFFSFRFNYCKDRAV